MNFVVWPPQIQKLLLLSLFYLILTFFLPFYEYLTLFYSTCFLYVISMVTNKYFYIARLSLLNISF